MVLCQISTISPSNPGMGEWGDAIDRCIAIGSVHGTCIWSTTHYCPIDYSNYQCYIPKN